MRSVIPVHKPSNPCERQIQRGFGGLASPRRELFGDWFSEGGLSKTRPRHRRVDRDRDWASRGIVLFGSDPDRMPMQPRPLHKQPHTTGMSISAVHAPRRDPSRQKSVVVVVVAAGTDRLRQIRQPNQGTKVPGEMRHVPRVRAAAEEKIKK
jgi:hypothetical protein